MRLRAWIGFAALCLLSGSRWLLDEAIPPPLPPLLRASAHFGLISLALVAYWLARRGSGFPLMRSSLLLTTFGAAVWIVPDAVISGAGGHVTGLTEALVFTLVPVVVVFAVAQQTEQFGVGDDPRGLLGPALGGVCGAALLFPFTTPTTVAGRLWLAGLVGSAVLAGLAAVWLHAAVRKVPVAAAAALVSAGIAGVSGVCSFRDGGLLRGLSGREVLVELLVTAVFDGPLLLLGVWLLRELRPVAFGTRYLLILLVTVAESYTLMRPAASWPMALGALMMAGSSTWLLRASVMNQGAARDDSGSTLRL